MLYTELRSPASPENTNKFLHEFDEYFLAPISYCKIFRNNFFFFNGPFKRFLRGQNCAILIKFEKLLNINRLGVLLVLSSKGK